jgi:hypothetical protein
MGNATAKAGPRFCRSLSPVSMRARCDAPMWARLPADLLAEVALHFPQGDADSIMAVRLTCRWVFPCILGHFFGLLVWQDIPWLDTPVCALR